MGSVVCGKAKAKNCLGFSVDLDRFGGSFIFLFQISYECFSFLFFCFALTNFNKMD